VWRWLDRIADESHRSHTIAARYHGSYVLVYLVLAGLYVGAASFHWAAVKRHQRS
jgi:hypothetical protein